MTDQTPEQVAAMFRAGCDQLRHACETQRVAIELLNKQTTKLQEELRRIDEDKKYLFAANVANEWEDRYQNQQIEIERLKAERDQLAAEVVRLKSWRDETFTDERGTTWTRPEPWAYYAACRTLNDQKKQLAERAERLAKLREALLIYADEKNWNCPRCGKRDSVNCFMGRWTGPVNPPADPDFHMGEGHGYDVAREAIALIDSFSGQAQETKGLADPEGEFKCECKVLPTPNMWNRCTRCNGSLMGRVTTETELLRSRSDAEQSPIDELRRQAGIEEIRYEEGGKQS